MKNYIYLLFFVFTLSSCYDDYPDENLIPDLVFSTTINLNLPESTNLLIPSGYVVYSNLGHRGVIVYNTGMGEQSVDEFLAFDLACPHIAVISCANAMDISGFPELKNSCDSDGIYYRFDIGVSTTYSKDEQGNSISIEGTSYELQQYKVDRVGAQEIRISNY